LRFDEFICEYDKPGSIVLLVGKRHVPVEDGEKLIITKWFRENKITTH